MMMVDLRVLAHMGNVSVFHFWIIYVGLTNYTYLKVCNKFRFL
jgi:hypothetical protein